MSIRVYIEKDADAVLFKMSFHGEEIEEPISSPQPPRPPPPPPPPSSPVRKPIVKWNSNEWFKKKREQKNRKRILDKLK